MNNNWNRSKSRQMAYFKYGDTPANRKWKASTISSACIVLVLMLSMLIWGDSMTIHTILWFRGITGVFALISIICAAIFYYRIHTAYIAGCHQNDEQT